MKKRKIILIILDFTLYLNRILAIKVFSCAFTSWTLNLQQPLASHQRFYDVPFFDSMHPKFWAIATSNLRSTYRFAGGKK